MASKKERIENKICLTTLQTMFINSQEFALLRSKLHGRLFVEGVHSWVGDRYGFNCSFQGNEIVLICHF